LIEDLEATGRTLSEISALLGFASSFRVLLHYKRGVQPLYHRGEPLIDLWCQVLEKQRTEVPKIPVRVPYRVPYSVRQRQEAAEVLVSVFPPVVVKRKVKREAA
jgi:hypothetical protein